MVVSVKVTGLNRALKKMQNTRKRLANVSLKDFADQVADRARERLLTTTLGWPSDTHASGNLYQNIKSIDIGSGRGINRSIVTASAMDLKFDYADVVERGRRGITAQGKLLIFKTPAGDFVRKTSVGPTQGKRFMGFAADWARRNIKGFTERRVSEAVKVA